ncbi:MAG: TPR repeat protein, partial [Psychromonas sp.]|uniref:tetratricopeptide repeat protein n=1 Tax=Psychromonas sp. TaxID=1884585 RepID=UPI0039E3D4B7
MLNFSRLSCWSIGLSLLCSQFVFASSEFTQGYEAAQAGDYQRAMQLWKPLAEAGDPAAQYTLGWLYESGQGVTQNYTQAIYWYTKAADKGDAAAQYVLATMYNKGTGVILNHQEAVKWFLKAANQGDAIAQFQLGTHFQQGLGVVQSDSESLHWFTKAATQGHLTAQINLGKIYQSGRGVEQDYNLAIIWYDKAASQGDALAQYHLGLLHEYGRGSPQNYRRAKSLYLKSANNYYAPSAYKLAEFYELGKGGDSNLQEALKWYKEAANKSNSAAQFKLGTMYQNGTGIEQNIYTAIDWYNSAALQNHAQALYRLGVIYEQGVVDKKGRDIIAKNPAKAVQRYQKASQLGYNLAHARLAHLYENGLGIAVDLQQALKLYQQSTQEWAIARYNLLSKQLRCFDSATTQLFSLLIACTDRQTLRKQIKTETIIAIDEDINNLSDTYFTGAVIRGSSELEVTYTREDRFVSAKYTFVGRSNPQLIGFIKTDLAQKYGQPDSQTGE